VREIFSFKPAHLITQLDLRRPIYGPTAAYGHFGRNEPNFTWEKIDAVQKLKKGAGL
jgi:S-adenosylmethionine synthetase